MIEELDVKDTSVVEDSINISEELRKLYRKQKRRTDLMMQKELEQRTVIRETTDNIAMQAKLLEQIHDVQSERNITDAIKAKDSMLEGIAGDYDN